MKRCAWCCDNGIMQKYHDEEWGIPLHDDKKHFEYLLMEAMQCGLNWRMMLVKREIFRNCFDDFNFYKIADYTDADVERIVSCEGMIKSRQKVKAIIANARAFIDIIEEFGSFDSYLWSFTEGRTYVYSSHHEGYVVASNDLSDKISRELKKRGFKYLGSVVIYSHLQACGMINDHDPSCFMYGRINKVSAVRYLR